MDDLIPPADDATKALPNSASGRGGIEASCYALPTAVETRHRHAVGNVFVRLECLSEELFLEQIPHLNAGSIIDPFTAGFDRTVCNRDGLVKAHGQLR